MPGPIPRRCPHWRRAGAGTLAAIVMALTATVTAAAPQSVNTSAVLPGEVIALRSSLITTPIAGTLRRIAVRVGDRVGAGALIAQIEVPTLIADEARDQAALTIAEADYEALRQAPGSTPGNSAPAAVDAAHVRVELARAQLQRTRTLLGYTSIRAPFDGTIAARYADPGAFVPVPEAGEERSGAIVRLADLSRVRIQVHVPAALSRLVHPGTRASVAVAGQAGKFISASVTAIGEVLESEPRRCWPNSRWPIRPACCRPAAPSRYACCSAPTRRRPDPPAHVTRRSAAPIIPSCSRRSRAPA